MTKNEIEWLEDILAVVGEQSKADTVRDLRALLSYVKGEPIDWSFDVAA